MSDATAEDEVVLPENLSDKQLAQIHKSAAEQIRERRAKERDADLNTIHALIAKHGFKASEVRVPKESKGSKVPAKYRNPEDPSVTWTGRGKAPAWIAEYAKEDWKEFLIQ